MYLQVVNRCLVCKDVNNLKKVVICCKWCSICNVSDIAVRQLLFLFLSYKQYIAC